MAAASPQDLVSLLTIVDDYEEGRKTFSYDARKQALIAQAIERLKINENKRKEFEARMNRKAKREGLPLDHYLKKGLDLPSVEGMVEMKGMDKDARFALWKEKHGQHCYAFHFEAGKCPRERACAFLHADVA
jgi:hypothetical protein